MSLVVNVIGMSSAVVAGVAGGVVADNVVNQETHIPIGLAIGVCMAALGIAVTVARQYQKIMDSIAILSRSVAQMQDILEKIPCRKAIVCEVEKPTDILFEDNP